ncbi:hypothetical protein KJ812_05875 [Patescibacteria group bacterium]|nr:hypothetical protein [Patescibacteria group bacterium]MBU4125791.1 hypothetical protein [Patescibacteria group bacterium]
MKIEIKTECVGTKTFSSLLKLLESERNFIKTVELKEVVPYSSGENKMLFELKLIYNSSSVSIPGISIKNLFNLLGVDVK